MKNYRIFEDFFLGAAFVIIIVAGAMKLLGVSFDIGTTVVSPKAVFALGITTLLFNIALNLQDLVRK
jgi:hypothetical protein